MEIMRNLLCRMHKASFCNVLLYFKSLFHPILLLLRLKECYTCDPFNFYHMSSESGRPCLALLFEPVLCCLSLCCVQAFSCSTLCVMLLRFHHALTAIYAHKHTQTHSMSSALCARVSVYLNPSIRQSACP